MRMPSYPLASQRKFGPAAKAKSRTLSAVKCQVSVPWVAGRVRSTCPASSFVIIATDAADLRAAVRRDRCAAVRTFSGLPSRPVAATTYEAGTVSATSKLPYSR